MKKKNIFEATEKLIDSTNNFYDSLAKSDEIFHIYGKEFGAREARSFLHFLENFISFQFSNGVDLTGMYDKILEILGHICPGCWKKSGRFIIQTEQILNIKCSINPGKFYRIL